MSLQAIDGGAMDEPLDAQEPNAEPDPQDPGTQQLDDAEPSPSVQEERFEFLGDQYNRKAEAERLVHSVLTDNRVLKERLSLYDQAFQEMQTQKARETQAQTQMSERQQVLSRLKQAAATGDPDTLLGELVDLARGSQTQQFSAEEARHIAMEEARRAAQAELDPVIGPIRAKQQFLSRKDLSDIHDMADEVVALQGRTNMSGEEITTFFRGVKQRAAETVRARTRGQMESAGTGGPPRSAVPDDKTFNNFTSDFWSREG